MSLSFEFQKAVVARLASDAALKALIGDPARIFDDIPSDGSGRPKAAFPYVSIGAAQDVPDLADEYDGSELFLDLHVWSRAVGFGEAKRIASALTARLHEADLTITGHRVLLIERGEQRFLRDPDGLTRHAVLTIRALTEPV